ncbi:MAG: nucleotidyltransferase family protein, partial [Elusimicrobiales bacterium]
MDDFLKIKMRNTILLNEIYKMDSSFYEEGIIAILIKGAALILKGYIRFCEREMSDVDVVVRERDYDKVVRILEKKGFDEIKDGRHAYYRGVGDMFAPVIFDVHSYFSNLKFDDIEFEDLDDCKAFKLPSDSDLLIITAVHSVIKHGFFDDRCLKDFR